MKSEETQLAVIATDIGYIKKAMDKLDSKVSSHYVSKEEFEPVKKIVYGLVGLILVAVAGAILGLVIR